MPWIFSIVALWILGHCAVAQASPKGRRSARHAQAMASRVEPLMRAAEQAEAHLNPGEAIKRYQAALVLAPDYVPALLRMCTAYSEVDMHSPALRACRQALQIEPSSETQASLANALARASKPEQLAEADALLDRARAHPPVPPEVHAAQLRIEWARANPEGMRAAFAAYRAAQSDEVQVAAQESRLALGLALTKLPDARTQARALARDSLAGAPADVRSLLRVGQVAIGVGDEALLEEVTNRVRELVPKTLWPHYLAGSLAELRGAWSLARAEFTQARDAGWPEEPSRRAMQRVGMRETEQARARMTAQQKPAPQHQPPFSDEQAYRYGRLAGNGLLGWAASLLFLLIAGSMLSALTIRAARRLAETGAVSLSRGSSLLRYAYTAVIAAACVFFYVSVPLLTLGILALLGLYLFAVFELGRVPLQLTLAVVVLAFVTLRALFKSVFLRIRDQDPGLPLDLRSQPALRALLDEVAAKVGTRAVDSVYLTPGAEIGVFERGGLTKQAFGQSERCLVLGLAVLEGMLLSDFKAILAHEYGHFSNRDTAGGGVSLAVRRSLALMGLGLAHGGAATWYNPAWWFYRAFHRIFLRVSQGASRLQEILADRHAALHYGPESMARGLQHAIEASIRFELQAVALHSAERLDNLYEHLRAVPLDPAQVAARVRSALEAKPTPYDSHPAPADRIAWVRNLPAQRACDGRPAWSALQHREQLEQQITTLINHTLQQGRV
jgi:Zn-dependent protease with chaperone function